MIVCVHTVMFKACNSGTVNSGTVNNDPWNTMTSGNKNRGMVALE